MRSVREITIVGGGTAGWLTAAYLGRKLKPLHIVVNLVDKEYTERVGVGESLLLSFLSFMEEIHYEMSDWFNEVDATFKSGILFPGWGTDDNVIWHPFRFNNFDRYPSYDYWSRRQDQIDLKSILPLWNTAMDNRVETSGVRDYYAFHLDCGKLVDFLQKSNDYFVNYIKSGVSDIHWKGEEISQLTLENGQVLESDLFIDCTGWKQLLGKHKTNVDLSDRLYVNTAVATHIPFEDKTKELRPYTTCTAVDHGWIWTIPVQSRMGSGLVFNRDITDIETAKDFLFDHWKGRESKDKMKVLRWDPFVCDKHWVGNVVSNGLSSGFIEPIESTGIALIIRTCKNIHDSILNGYYEQGDVDIFNTTVSYDYESAVDYVNMHYSHCNRSSSPFWDYVKKNYKMSGTQKYYEDILYDTEQMSFNGPKRNGIFAGHNWNVWLNQLLPEIPAKTYDSMLKYNVFEPIVDACYEAWQQQLETLYKQSIHHEDCFR
jgi:hypothetical protein